MTKDKVTNRQEIEGLAGKGSSPALGSESEASASPSSTYAACMRVYLWMSQRYRKTLDALAK